MNVVEVTTSDLLRKDENKLPKKEHTRFIIVNGYLVKIYKGLPKDEKGNIYSRLFELEKRINFSEANVPIPALYKGEFIGSAQLFYPKCVPFYEVDNIARNNYEYISYLKEASNILRKFHSRRVVLGDVSFQNIILVKKSIKFVDLDFCGVGKIRASAKSGIYYEFISKYCPYVLNYPNTEQDKLSFILEFICTYFCAPLFSFDFIDIDEYNDLIINKCSSKSLKEILIMLAKCLLNMGIISLPIPYLGDIISYDDQLYNERLTK